MWRKASLYTAAKNLSGIVIIEIMCRFLEKLKRTARYSSNPTTGYLSKGDEISVSKKYLYSHA